jgi:hypothetical protein
MTLYYEYTFWYGSGADRRKSGAKWGGSLPSKNSEPTEQFTKALILQPTPQPRRL